MGHKSNKALAARVESLPFPDQSWPRWIVSGGGAGFLRPAPGSWGTAVPAALYWAALIFGLEDPARSWAFLLFGTLAGILLVAYGKWAASYYREPDPGTCVLDEYTGFSLAVAFVPVPPSAAAQGILGLFLFTSCLYILFRLTDTLKIPPANYLERLPWGWGVLFDDVAAGLQANLVAQVVVRLWFMP